MLTSCLAWAGANAHSAQLRSEPADCWLAAGSPQRLQHEVTGARIPVAFGPGNAAGSTLSHGPLA